MDLTSLDAIAARPGLPELLQALGASQARLVGGAVRDGLLSLPTTDIDLATVLSPYEVMRRCGAAGIRTVPTGIAHGTVTALTEGQPVEITTLRCDVSTDGRHATIAYTDDWREDAARRDFTINALFYDPASRQISDYFNGLDDLAEKRVRFIGEPLQRIAEDHLRILRFFRFTARYATKPDTEGLAACSARANDLMALSRERIADEWLKLLALPDPADTVALMLSQRVLEPVLPELTMDRLPALRRLIRSEALARILPEPLRRFAALLPPDQTTADKVAARLKLSNKSRKRLVSAAVGDLDLNPRALAYRIGREEALDRLLLAGQADAAAALTRWEVPRLSVGGGMLIARGLQPGPAVARVLKRIETRWVNEGFPDAARIEQIVSAELAEAT